MTRVVDVEKLQRDLDYRVREVETLNGHVRQLAAALDARAREIEELNRTVAERQDAVRARGAEVDELHAALRVRAEEVACLNADVARLQRDLATRAREVETLARALDARAREAEGLGQALGRTTEAAPAPVREPLGSLQAVPRRLDVKGLVWTIVRTDLKVRYHGTLGGLLWALLKPLATLAVLLTVFGLLFADASDYALKLVVGIVLWEFFAEGTKVGLLSLAIKGHLVSKAVFPRWIIVATSQANAMVPLLVFSVALLVVLAAQGRTPGVAAVVAYGAGLVLLAAIVFGLSLATSVLFVRYRDLNQLWEVAIQAGFFLAPIVYPVERVPESLRGWLWLWPPTAAIEYARTALLEGRVPPLPAQAMLAGLAVAALVVGVLIFRRLEPRVAEYV